MTFSDLQSMTVIQLRKLARENSVVLGAGIDKATMIEKIAADLGISAEPQQQSFLDLADIAVAKEEPAAPSVLKEEPVSYEKEAAPEAASDAPAEKPERNMRESFRPAAASRPVLRESPLRRSSGFGGRKAAFAAPATDAGTAGEPRFQAAWHSSDAPQSAPASRAPYASTGAARPAWQNTSPSGRPLPDRPQPLRSRSFGPRFGPASAAAEPVSSPGEASARVPSPLPDHRVGFGGSTGFGPAMSEPVAPSASAPLEEESSLFADSASGNTPTLEELLATGDFEQGSGILELHPDGYGFLRAPNFMPSSRDIYVSMAQIRRFSLRTGDMIVGKIRPQREGDKYAALLYIDTVNGMTEEESLRRPHFDELTAVYPSRRMSLEAKEGPSLPDMRLIDLIAPLGFGQRGLLLCPPDTGKRELLQHYANTIIANYPDASVLTLLIDMTPEDVTVFREHTNCPVLASTFDQAPEAHLRLTEMVVERAMRLVELGKDVVILADSLTRLAKIYTSAAAQQGRSLPGMVNPASLLRAKRMFGSARAMKEGGSLTVIAAMDIASGNKVDDSVVEEFKGTANMELQLDQSLVRAGIYPPINLSRSFTKNSDLLLNDQQKEGLTLIRQVLGTTSSGAAIPQLMEMMDKASSNSDLLMKIKEWFKLMGL